MLPSSALFTVDSLPFYEKSYITLAPGCSKRPRTCWGWSCTSLCSSCCRSSPESSSWNSP